MAINGVTSEQYYSDSNNDNYGNYSFVFLEDLVNNFQQNFAGDDTVLGYIPRHKIVGRMKQCIKEFTYSTLHEPKIVELDLGEQLDIIKPQDYVDYIRISWVDKANGRIMPMSENRHNPLGIAYLQDQDANFLYDDSGDVLIGTTILEQESDKKKTNPIMTYIDSVYPSFVVDKPIYNLDTSINGNGTFSQNQNRIHFSSESSLRTILLEYVSDGLEVDEAKINVHKYAEQALYASVHYELAKASIKVPEYEKRRIEKERNTLVRNAKIRLLNIKPQEFIQALKAMNKWIR